MQRLILFFFFGFNLFILSCQSNIDKGAVLPSTFFDITQYLHQEIEIHQKSSVLKTVAFNHQEETKKITSFDLRSDLTPFFKSNINRVNWYDKYQVDTMKTNTTNSFQITYTSLDRKLRTDQMIIKITNGEVQSLEIHNSTKNLFMNLEEVLIYEQGMKYSLLNKQKIIGNKPQVFKMTVQPTD